jgi:Mg2+/Co2+ transporter CorC
MGSDKVEPVGGLRIVKLSDIPTQGQRIELPRVDIVVKKINGPHIVLVKVIAQLHGGVDRHMDRRLTQGVLARRVSALIWRWRTRLPA